MNKRQAKRGIVPHGDWAITREILRYIKPPKMLPRWRQRKKWHLKAVNRDCTTCVHSDETDGSNCYECVKGSKDNYEAVREVSE